MIHFDYTNQAIKASHHFGRHTRCLDAFPPGAVPGLFCDIHMRISDATYKLRAEINNEGLDRK